MTATDALDECPLCHGPLASHVMRDPIPPAAPTAEKQLWRRHGRYGKFDHDPDTADVAYECEDLGEGCKLHKPGQFAAQPQSESERLCERCGQPITDRCWRHD